MNERRTSETRVEKYMVGMLLSALSDLANQGGFEEWG